MKTFDMTHFDIPYDLAYKPWVIFIGNSLINVSLRWNFISREQIYKRNIDLLLKIDLKLK